MKKWEHCIAKSTYKLEWFDRLEPFKVEFYYRFGKEEVIEKWESGYYYFDWYSHGPAHALDYLGKKGWELVYIKDPPEKGKFDGVYFYAILKRPIEE